MDIVKVVQSMRSKLDWKSICEQETDLHRKVVLCKRYLSSNVWSILLEKHIKKTFNIVQKSGTTHGDGISPKKFNIEIKISLGSSTGNFNFVQLRPNHKIHYYLFLCYDLYFGDIGKIYWFLCKPEELYALIPDFGSYSHGSIQQLGKITMTSIKLRNNNEYSLRPNPGIGSSKSNILWSKMLEKFSCDEEYIRSVI